MKIGRNDPCRCGSGKKYKKCCMQKDQEAEQAARLAASPQPVAATQKPNLPSPTPPALPPPDPRIQAFNVRWEEFEEQDYEGQIALFLQTLDDKDLMDEEMAFEMLNVIFSQSVAHNERDRFDTLVETLQERVPEVYAHDAHYYLEWRITNALATGRLEAIPALAHTMAQTAGKDLDIFRNVMDQLAYHGQLAALVEATRTAWPLVRKSRDLMSWAIPEFAEEAANYVIFDHLEHNPAPDAADATLKERLEFYLKPDPERVARHLALLTDQAGRRWVMSDFEFKRPRRRSRGDFAEGETARVSDDGRQSLHDLSIEFLGYLRREEGVSYTKGALACKELQRYILDRSAGEVGPDEDLFAAPFRKRAKPKAQARLLAPLLCPDRGTLDRYLGELFNFINPHHYKAAALMELVPAWLRFLESRQLIDAQQRQKTLNELRGLDAELLKIYQQYPADPALRRGIEHWQESAELELSLTQGGQK